MNGSVRYLNPSSTVAQPRGAYSHIAIGTGSEIIGFAGQVGLNREGSLVGLDDVAAQTQQTLANLGNLLTEVDLQWSSILSLRTYVAGPEHLPGYRSAAAAFYAKAFRDNLPPPNTLLVVVALARPEFLVEVEALALRP